MHLHTALVIRSGEITSYQPWDSINANERLLYQAYQNKMKKKVEFGCKLNYMGRQYNQAIKKKTTKETQFENAFAMNFEVARLEQEFRNTP